MDNGNSRNEDIRIFDQLSCLPQSGVYLCRLIQYRLIDHDDAKCLPQLFKGTQLLVCPSKEESTTRFVVADGIQHHWMASYLCITQASPHQRVFLEVRGDNIGIEEVAVHRSSWRLPNHERRCTASSNSCHCSSVRSVHAASNASRAASRRCCAAVRSGTVTYTCSPSGNRTVSKRRSTPFS